MVTLMKLTLRLPRLQFLEGRLKCFSQVHVRPHQVLRRAEAGHAVHREKDALYREDNTDSPAYSDTGNSDTPLTVTVLACPKWPIIYEK